VSKLRQLIYQKEVRYLGVFFGIDGVDIDPSKVQTINKWPKLESVKDIPCFLDFVNFYQRFIDSYCINIASLTYLTKKKWLSNEIPNEKIHVNNQKIDSYQYQSFNTLMPKN
jgi:hypothetical protein